jgi:hypothetical protein
MTDSAWAGHPSRSQAERPPGSARNM